MFGNYGTSKFQGGQKASEIEQGAQDEEVAERQADEAIWDAVTDALGHGDIGNPRIKSRAVIDRLEAAGFKIVAK